MAYEYKRKVVYLSTDSRDLTITVVNNQRERDPKGDYRGYELVGDKWSEIPVETIPLFR